MSNQKKRPFSKMMPIAEWLINELQPYFDTDHLCIVGSLRREREMIGDIEILGVPLYPVKEIVHQLGLFETPKQAPIKIRPYLFENYLDQSQYIKRHLKGNKYQSFWLQNKGEPYKVDLFCNPDPRTWGQNKVVRTGSSEFSRYMVTSKSKGGAVPENELGKIYKSEGARWRRIDRMSFGWLDTPTEKCVFELLEQKWIEPNRRDIEYKGEW